MKDKRYKEIMKGLGQPNSQSLLVALQQVANEVAQECIHLSKSGKSMSFGQAIHYAKSGRKVARVGWNGSGMFAYIVPKQKMPPTQSVFRDIAERIIKEDGIILREHWELFTAQKDIAMWSPSGSDSLANDWLIVE
jgi:hypothetical protein